jgi:hypothetical protein
MKLFLYSGLLYLAGVSVVLYLKPELMFNKEGEWKEFGLGRHPDRYTWLPFWLFSILWAMLSYLLVLTLFGPEGQSIALAPAEVMIPTEELEPENVSIKSLASSIKKRPANQGEMKKGYYILDAAETARRGIPKYIYLGPEAPNLVYNEEA